jgi:hypothetical protein
MDFRQADGDQSRHPARVTTALAVPARIAQPKVRGRFPCRRGCGTIRADAGAAFATVQTRPRFQARHPRNRTTNDRARKVRQSASIYRVLLFMNLTTHAQRLETSIAYLDVALYH